jgi:hypothetical protein
LARVATANTANQVENLRQHRVAELAQEFPECVTAQGVQQLQVNDPYRWQQFVGKFQQYDNEVKARQLDTAVQQHQVSQYQAAAFENYRAVEDAKFHAAHPELNGPALAKLAPYIMAELREKFNVTDQQIAHAYNNDPQFRSYAAQEMAVQLGRQRMAREEIKSGRRRPVPPVTQRPGSIDTAKQYEHRGIDALDRKLDKTGKVRDATNLLLELRRARSR